MFQNKNKRDVISIDKKYVLFTKEFLRNFQLVSQELWDTRDWRKFFERNSFEIYSLFWRVLSKFNVSKEKEFEYIYNKFFTYYSDPQNNTVRDMNKIFSYFEWALTLSFASEFTPHLKVNFEKYNQSVKQYFEQKKLKISNYLNYSNPIQIKHLYSTEFEKNENSKFDIIERLQRLWINGYQKNFLIQNINTFIYDVVLTYEDEYQEKKLLIIDFTQHKKSTNTFVRKTKWNCLKAFIWLDFSYFEVELLIWENLCFSTFRDSLNTFLEKNPN